MSAGLMDTARRRLAELIDGFVPPSMATDPTASKHARMFVTSHLMGPILGGTVPIALWAMDPTPGADILVLAAAIMSFWLFPFALLWGVPFNALVLLSIFIDWFAILWSAYFYGGISSPTIIWILIIPILAIFYIGGERALKPWLALMSALCFGTFLVVCVVLEPPANDIPPGLQTSLGVVSVAGVLAYVAAMAIYYAKIFDAGVDLETEVRRRESMAAELREAVRLARRASAAKSEFLARMSHELRNPLNAIIGYGSLLKEEAEDEGDDVFQGDVDRILDAGRYLVRLIDMILDLSKMEAGRMQLDLRPHPLAELVREVVERGRDPVEKARNRLVLDLPEQLGEVVVDRGRVHQVIESVLENAAQHTEGGTVTVSARREGESFRVSVTDTGSGMAPDLLATVFENFSTPREAAGGRYGGTGLSLTVCHWLCRVMGGTIEASSAPGEGSAFTIELPAAPNSADAAEPPLRPVAGPGPALSPPGAAAAAAAAA